MGTSAKRIKIGLISLGCDKNRVDAEKMLALLEDAGYTITSDQEEADGIIVNTCAFIKPAKVEAIDNIFAAAKLKEKNLKKLIVTGCFSTRYGDEVKDEIPEVDRFVKIEERNRIVQIIDELFGVNREEKQIDCPYQANRIITTPMHYAYLKIADGCNNRCSYCAIPNIRGKYVSEKIEDLVKEAEILYESGVKELILVAQDTTYYGKDIYGKYALIDLLKELVKINFWKIRILYAYPERITKELIEYIDSEPKIAKYLDIPLQHINDDLLKKMRRPATKEKIKNLLSEIGSTKNYIATRSSFIVGFPTESEKEHEELVEFVKDGVDYGGFFVFSPEEGTPAYEYKPRATKKLATKWQIECEKAQVVSTESKQKRLIGKTVEVIYEGIDYKKGMFYGRTEYNAPEIDTVVYFKSAFPVEIGNVYMVKINGGSFNLVGETIQ